PPRSHEATHGLKVHIGHHKRQVQRPVLRNRAGGVRHRRTAVSLEAVDFHATPLESEHNIRTVDCHAGDVSTCEAQAGLPDDGTRRPGGGDESGGLALRRQREQIERRETPSIDALEIGQDEELPGGQGEPRIPARSTIIVSPLLVTRRLSSTSGPSMPVSATWDGTKTARPSCSWSVAR